MNIENKKGENKMTDRMKKKIKEALDNRDKEARDNEYNDRLNRIKENTKMISVSSVNVIESNLYEVWGEDSKLVVYDLVVQAVCDKDVYNHVHVFKGYWEDDEGFNHPNYGAKEDAHRLAGKVLDRGTINLLHWNLI